MGILAPVENIGSKYYLKSIHIPLVSAVFCSFLSVKHFVAGREAPIA